MTERLLMWHTTAPERAALIEREGLRGHQPIFSYNHVTDAYARIHGAGVEPVYVATLPVGMGIHHHYLIKREDLVCFAIDATGLELHVDLPMMRANYCMSDLGGEFRMHGDDMDHAMLDVLREVVGDPEERIFDYRTLLHERVRAQALADCNTAISIRPIGPERILACYPFETACGMDICRELIPGFEERPLPASAHRAA